jgi:transposase
MDKYPFDTKVISSVLGINYGTFYRWYKKILSDYSKDETKIELHENDLKSCECSCKKDICVPIFRPDRIGEVMAIDEKHINNEFYTVLTNGETGKVAMLCATLESSKIGSILSKFGDNLNITKVLTRDLSNVFEAVGNKYFSQAIQVADKFHIIKHGLETLQNMRIRYKQQAMREEIEKGKTYYNEQIMKQIDKPRVYKAERLVNGETLTELLSRCRYLLYKMPENWTDNQKKRATLLFEHCPELRIACNYITMFRKWYQRIDKENPTNKEGDLFNWIYSAEDTKIPELLNFVKLVENNYEVILNFFKGYHSNAIAESTNAKIQRVIINNRGVRDIDFFHYKLGLIF